LNLLILLKVLAKKLLEHEKLSPRQTKALYDIMLCRTASLGGHEQACDCCGTIGYSYNSCGNRYCPKCQVAKQIAWVEKIVKKTLAVKHYHIIFTIPHCLNKICLYDDKMFYKLFFDAVEEPCTALDILITELNLVLLLCYTLGGKIFRCTHITVLFLPLVTHSMEHGSILERRGTICTQCIS